MANNRMILLCNVCQPNDSGWKYHDKGTLAIKKWYPGNYGAYYSNTPAEELGRSFQEFLNEHAHTEIASEHYSVGAGQENPIRLIYESKGLPKL